MVKILLLGAGKTLTLTYLSWLNWYRKRSKLYANYSLYKIPYIYIDSVEKLDTAHSGHISMDEFWQYLDARSTTSTRNRVTSSILLRSRKRDLTYMFTTQMLDLLDKRVRKILDFTAYTLLNPQETVGKTLIFRGGYPKEGMILKTMRFYTQGVFQLYSTNQEINMIEDDGQPPKIIFQESPEHPPKYFDDFESADKFAENFWAKNTDLLSLLIAGQ